MEKERSQRSGFSAIAVSATLSLIALLSVGTWQAMRSVQATNTIAPIASVAASEAASETDTGGVDPRQGYDVTSTATNTTDFTEIGAGVIGQLVGSYSNLQQQGAYTPEAAQSVAKGIGENLRPQISYTPFNAGNIQTDSDISGTRVAKYRTDLQTALKPLLKNTEAEYVVFGRYVESGDKNNLVELQTFAENYRAAVTNAAALTVPDDARATHLALLNAMQEFATTLDMMSTHAADPFAAAALLTSYNNSEHGVLSAFQGLVTYFKQKS